MQMCVKRLPLGPSTSIWLLLTFAVLAGCERTFSANTAGETLHRKHTRALPAVWSRKLQQGAPGTGCQVGAWGPFSDCARTGINQWSRSRSRQVVKQGSNCPELTDLVDCEPVRQPRPDDAAGVLQQTTLAMVTAIPLAITTALDDKSSNQAPDVGFGPEQEAIPPPEIAAGRALWTQKASSYDRMTCLPFNGQVGLLSGASGTSKSPAVQQALLKAGNSARAAVAAARASFNNSANSGANANPRTGVQSVDGELAAVVWDGDVTLGAQFHLDGAMSEPEAQLAVNVMADTVYNLMPWMVVQDKLPSSSAMNLSVAYDSTAQAATLTSNSDDPLTLLSAIKLPLQYIYGLNPPSSPDSLESLTTTSSVRVSASQGVQELAVSLDGEWSPSALSLRLGMPWVLPDDMFSIAPEPLVLYNAVPSVLYVAVTADVPAIGVSGMTSTLNFQPGQQVSLQLYGATNPIPHLTIADDLMLSARQGGGFISLTQGWLADLPVSVAATITRGKAVSFTMTTSAATANLENLVHTIFTPEQVPEFLLNFIKPIQFSRVTVTYTSSSGNSSGPSPSSSTDSSDPQGSFSILAVPDIDGAPQLKQIMNAVGLGVTDIALSSTGSSPGSPSLTLGLQQPFELQLPDPFTKAGPTLLTFAQDQVTQAVVLTGSLQASLMLPGVANPVTLQISTGISTGEGNAVTAHFTGTAFSPTVSFNDFKFVQFGAMHLAASVSYEPLLLNQLTLAGPVTLFGVSAPAIFTYDKQSKGLVFMAELPQLDVQLLAQSVGAKIKPGNLNAQLTGVKQTYAAAAAPSMGVPAGMLLSGDLEFLGMQSRVQFEVSPDGVGLVAAFNSSQFSQAFKGLITSKLQGILQSAAAAIQQTTAAAPGASSQSTASTSQLDKYMSDLLQAQQQFGAASNAFDAAKKKAVDTLAAAQGKANTATSAFDALRKKRGQALDDAATKYRTADAALVAADVKAFGELEDAKEALTTSQTEFAAAVSDALVAVEIAQTAANELKSSYNANNSRCDAWPWTQSNCAAAASGWTAYQLATSQLDSAASKLDAVSSGAPYAKLAAARNSLTEAQKAVNQVASGTKWASRQAALAALSSAKDAAAAVNTSSEAGAFAAANNNLREAQAALHAAFEGSAEWNALNAAKSALESAEAQMNAAKAADKETVEACNAAVEALTLAQQEVQTENFLQLTSLAVNFNLKRDSTMLFAFYDITVASQQLRGRFAVDVNNTTEDIKIMLLNVIKSEAVSTLKAKFQAIQRFMV